MAFILVYVTNSNLDNANKLSKHIIKKKLAACVNIFPINSMYHWREKIQNDNEIVTLFKTKSENWNKLKQEIEKIHSYDIPCIIKIDVTANELFEKWINKELQ